MKSKINLLIVLVMTFIILAGCGGNAQIEEDQACLIFGKIIARRLGVATVQRYPVLAYQIEPVAKAILNAEANGDDLITVLQKGLMETSHLDPLTKRDIKDLLQIIKINNVRDVYQHIAVAFLEGITISSSLNLPNVE